MSNTDISSNLANLLPTGTFLTFQAVAPIFTNNGSCHGAERLVTSILVTIFGIICVLHTYSDSLTTSTGKIYYGIVTPRGLYNPQFRTSKVLGVLPNSSFYTGDQKYVLTIFDTINAVLSVTVFCSLSLLTPPVSSCFFPSISPTIIKTVPVLVGIVVGFYFSFAPTPRRGVGFGVNSLITADVHKDGADSTARSTDLPVAGLTDTSDEQKIDADTATQSTTEPQDTKIKSVTDETPVQRIGTTTPAQSVTRRVARGSTTDQH